MIPTLIISGDTETAAYLTEVAARTLDLHDAFDAITDDLFAIQRRWWVTNGEGTWAGPSETTIERDARGGRDPEIMRVTGGLEAAATVRGAKRQSVRVGAQSSLLAVTDGLAVIQQGRGRQVMADPSDDDIDRFGDTIANYILTGRA